MVDIIFIFIIFDVLDIVGIIFVIIFEFWVFFMINFIDLERFLGVFFVFFFWLCCFFRCFLSLSNRVVLKVYWLYLYGRLLVCNSMCRFMFLMRLKDCLYILYWWGFFRVWVSKWYFKFCFRVVLKLYFGYLKVFLVWISLCVLSWFLWAVVNLYTLYKCFFVVLWVIMWFFSVCFYLNLVL